MNVDIHHPLHGEQLHVNLESKSAVSRVPVTINTLMKLVQIFIPLDVGNETVERDLKISYSNSNVFCRHGFA